MTTQPTSLERLQHLLPQLFTSTDLEGSPFLRAQLTADITVGIPLHYVEEVRLISHEMLTLMPNMPDSVLGLVQAKGHIFWLVNLAEMIGLTVKGNRSNRYEMIMVRTQDLSLKMGVSSSHISNQDLFLGFAVQRVKGTLRLHPEDLKTLEEDRFSASNPCLAGTIVKNDERISILNF